VADSNMGRTQSWEPPPHPHSML